MVFLSRYSHICLRYITKITDQVVALISAEHANAMVWEQPAKNPSVLAEGNGFNRLFAFKVAKTNEQEEGVDSRQGFTVRMPFFSFLLPSNVLIRWIALSSNFPSVRQTVRSKRIPWHRYYSREKQSKP